MAFAWLFALVMKDNWLLIIILVCVCLLVCVHISSHFFSYVGFFYWFSTFTLTNL